MDSLPLEIKLMIFIKLPLPALLRAKAVSKNWKIIIENHLPLKSFTIYRHIIPINDRWAFSSQYVDTNQSLKLNVYKEKVEELRLNYLFSTILSNLKYLYIVVGYVDLSTRFVENLNELTKLERLRLSKFVIRRNVTWFLPNLKLLELNIEGTSLREDEIRIKHHKLTLDTEMLTKLKIVQINPFSSLVFKYPNRLTDLETNYYRDAIQMFTNLEVFYCKNFDDLTSEPILCKFKRLKEVHLHDKVTFIRLASERKKFDLNIDLYLFGVNLTDLSDFELFSNKHIVWEDKAKMICSNYDKLAPISPFIQEIHYASFKDEFIADDFGRKFTNLNSIFVYHDVDPSHLNQFLKSCTPNELHFNYTNLSNEYYYHLVDYCPTIQRLNIAYLDEQISRNLNFNFVLNFKYLTEFTTDFKFKNQPDFIIIKCLFSELEHFERANFFRSKGEQIDIRKIDNGYELVFNKRKKFSNLNQLERNLYPRVSKLSDRFVW